MKIPITQARAEFTQALVAFYQERIAPTSFLTSFFRTVEKNSLYLSIEVKRGTERIAADVLRGTEGNRNTFSRSTEKIFKPPHYREFFDATELDFYDRLFTDTTGEVPIETFTNWLEVVIEKLGLLQDLIERSYELQCAQNFEDGIVTLVNGDNIDFKRKPASKVALGSGDRWNESTSDPIKDLRTAGDFMRSVGKAQGGIFNAIMGSDSFDSFVSHAKIVERGDLKDIDFLSLQMPQRQADGGVPHGRVSAGSYKFNIWTYPEFYEDKNGNTVPFINPKKTTIIPEKPNFTLGFAGVPTTVSLPDSLVQKAIGFTKGAYVIGEYLDERKKTHIWDITSSGLAIPEAIDQIYTLQTEV